MCSISWWLCNTCKYFLKIVLILGSIGLHYVIKLHKVRFSASSLGIFLTLENYFLTLVGL